MNVFICKYFFSNFSSLGCDYSRAIFSSFFISSFIVFPFSNFYSKLVDLHSEKKEERTVKKWRLEGKVTQVLNHGFRGKSGADECDGGWRRGWEGGGDRG